jgi:ribosome biogenesis GTPase
VSTQGQLSTQARRATRKTTLEVADDCPTLQRLHAPGLKPAGGWAAPRKTRFFQYPHVEARPRLTGAALFQPLFELGFGPAFFASLDPSELDPHRIGRVLRSAHGRLQLATVDGIQGAILDGPLRDRRHPTVVGDWVVLRLGDPVVAVRRLERTSTLARRDPAGGPQIVAANVDRAVICTAADRDWRVRRIERWLAVVAESGCEPALLLTKADLHPDPQGLLAEIAAWAPSLPVAAVSRVTGDGRDALMGLLEPGKTTSLLGSSGVGKSTLVNWILGADERDVGELRRDGRGRHTTTDRHLYRLESGAWLLDNPGVRQVGPLSDAGLADAFPEIAAAVCRFRDCAHNGEPGCAVQASIDRGEIAEDRLASWHKLQREVAFEARRTDAIARQVERARWKQIQKAHRRREDRYP